MNQKLQTPQNKYRKLEEKRLAKEEREYLKKEKKETNVYDNILSLIPVVRIENNAFLTKFGTYIDVFRFTSKDLAGCGEDEIVRDILFYDKFQKTFKYPHKYVGMNLPTNTKDQQQYFTYILNKTKNIIHKHFLEKQIAALQEIAQTCTDREYYLMIFPKTLEELQETQNLIYSVLYTNKLVTEMTIHEKKNVLFKYANKNTIIFAE